MTSKTVKIKKYEGKKCGIKNVISNWVVQLRDRLIGHEKKYFQRIMSSPNAPSDLFSLELIGPN